MTICSDFRVQKNKFCHCFHFFSFYLPWSNGTRCHDLYFLNVEKSQLFHSPLSCSSRDSLDSLLLSVIRVESCAYLRLLVILPAVLITACASSSLAFPRMYSAYKLNKQGNNIQPCHTPLLILKQSVVPCPIITLASWPTYRFLKRQVWYSHLFENFPVCCDPHKGFSIVNEAEVDVFLEFSCFLYDLKNVGNLISGSSTFSKSSLYTWKY